MNAREMIELMSRDPFEPLEIHLTNGTVINVEHPYLMATAPQSPVCTVHDELEDQPVRHVAYRNIAEVKFHSAASSEEQPE